VALVAGACRDWLLRAHRHRLRHEDLELLSSVRRGRRFSSRAHLANALEQRFLSRVGDRRRALRGRSPLQAALEGALTLGDPGGRGVEVVDPRAEVHPLVARRADLRRVSEVASRLTPDQRLILASQVALGMDRAEFCRRYGWSFEKYRKVAQRARARLRALMDAEPGLDWRGVSALDAELGVQGDRTPDLRPAASVLRVPPWERGRIREIGTHL
jgi:DNA-directed RNA polymerase specialized sigma24 family protein